MELTIIKEVLSSHTDIVTLLFILLIYLIYVFTHNNTKCKVCKFQTLVAQMRIYRDRIAPIMEQVLVDYATDFEKHIKENKINLSSNEVNVRLVAHRQLMIASFLQGERLLRECLIYNHIPDANTKEFLIYCEEKFHAHQNAVWSYYESVYNEKFYLLPITYRRNDKNEIYWEYWKDLFELFYKIGNGEYKTK